MWKSRLSSRAQGLQSSWPLQSSQGCSWDTGSSQHLCWLPWGPARAGFMPFPAFSSSSVYLDDCLVSPVTSALYGSRGSYHNCALSWLVSVIIAIGLEEQQESVAGLPWTLYCATCCLSCDSHISPVWYEVTSVSWQWNRVSEMLNITQGHHTVSELSFHIKDGWLWNPPLKSWLNDLL